MMKKIILLFVVLSTTFLQAQISDLTKLASGETEMFDLITDLDNKVYGYFAIYNIGEVSKTESRFKYVLLDKNLKQVMGGEFKDRTYKSFNHNFFNVDKVGSKLIFTKGFYYKKRQNRNFQFTSFRVLDLKKNELSNEFYYQNDTFIDGTRNEDTLKKTLRNEASYISVPTAFSNGIVMLKIAKKGKKSLASNNKKITDLKAYDLDRNQIWSFTYNQNNENLQIFIELNDKDNFMISTRDLKNNELVYSINPKDGKLRFKYTLNTKKSKLDLRYRVYATDQGVVIIGNESNRKPNGFDFNKDLGLFKVLLNNEGEVLQDKIFHWKNEGQKSKLQMDKGGRIEGKFGLVTGKYYVFKNGKITILAKKARKKINAYVPGYDGGYKTNGFAILNFDDSFKLDSHNLFDTTKFKFGFFSGNANSTYLFSQKIKDGNGVVFFYREGGGYYNSGKISIITIIDGKLTSEVLPSSETGTYIYPYKAKEGYVLFREVNSVEKTDKIRLERLNF